ncbi:MAG: alpha/beta family hydrolase [Candidatus Sulfotelmatobacter sp.]
MPRETTPQVFTDITVDPFVRGWLHTPATPTGDALVLTHGAGGNCNAPLLVALAETFTAAGFIVLRCDLPYRQNRPYGPPGPGDAKRDRAGLTNAVAAIKKIASARTYLGGQSYGGRQCSILAADLTPADLTAKEQKPQQTIAGLLLLSYPLHPPGKPEQLRTQHFSNLHAPTLIIQGTRDPFGSIAEIEQAIKQIPGKVKLAPVEGAGHDLGFKGKARREELPQTVLKEFQSFM